MFEGLFQPMHLVLLGGGCVTVVAVVVVVVWAVTKFSSPKSTAGDVAARLARLEDLKARSLVTEDEYQAKRRQILDQV